MNGKAQLRLELFDLFGADRFRDDENTIRSFAKTTLPQSTTPFGVVKPKSCEEVIALMQLIQRHPIRWHAISRGNNWGYGDACASTDGQLIIDLRLMNRIVEVNDELAYAVIEPGVSQGQLADHLLKSGSKLMLDVTGAGPDASIVGNTLQRGFGHTPYGDHYANSCNYEVVLPGGKLIRTGFGDVTQSNVGHVYPYGNGPCSQGTFPQSHAGIVTRMTVWLMPRYDAIVGFNFKTDDPAVFSKILDQIGQLRRNGTIESVVHMANDLRVLSTQPVMKESSGRRSPLSSAERSEMAKKAGIGKWNGLGGLYGSRRTVSAKKHELKKAFRGICPMRFFSGWQVRTLDKVSRRLPSSTRFEPLKNLSTAVSDVYDLLCGIPSAKHLEGAFYRNRPQSGKVIDAGLIWIAPVIPFTGGDARRVVSEIEQIANQWGFDLPITISPVVPRAAVCIANISYDKSETEQCSRAADCYQEISAKIYQLGYPPYRSSSVSLASLR